MSDMNFLKRLLNGAAVEWKALGELGEFVRGSGLQKSDFTDSGIGCIHYGQIYTFYGDYAYQTKSFVSARLAAKLRKAQKNDLIIATTSENIEDVCKPLVWLGEEEVCVSGETYIFKHNQNPKYLAYYLKTPYFYDFKKRNRTGTKVIRVHGDKLATFPIPVPCPDNPDRSLAIQAEIVRILDTFTELTAELTAELTDRKKQYNYYRDRLLTFEEGEAEWKTLGELANIKNGKDWKNLDTGEIPVYGSGGIMAYVNKYAYNKPTVLIPRKGSITNIFYVDYPIWNVDTIYYTEIDTSQILPKFFFYYMKTVDLMRLDTGSGRPSLTQTILNVIPIPIPPLSEQAHIVAILDKFDTLTHSISEGLPREIALRQQQYEYYRDLLLSFPKVEE